MRRLIWGLGGAGCRWRSRKDDAEQVGNVSHLRVATKYPNLTSRFFEGKGIQAECVKLNGAMELAPSLGSVAAYRRSGGIGEYAEGQ